MVRVRLQSQKAPDFSRLAITTNSLTPILPAEIGVTACCREVFFAGNDGQYCLATPKLSRPAPPPTECAMQQAQSKVFSSTLDGLRKIARNDGITALWRGLSPTLAMTVPANIIYFTGYDWLRYNPRSPLSHLSPDQAPLVAGSAARILAATAVSPIELVRTRMQAASGSSTTNHLVEAFQGIRQMVATNGYSSLWRGLTLTLWRDVPFSGLYWWGYESIRSGLTRWRRKQDAHQTSASDLAQAAWMQCSGRQKHRETFIDSFLAGALSGSFASFVTTPFDVGKTRTQVYRQEGSGTAQVEGHASGKAPEERNMVRLLRHIFTTEGLAGLWRGWIPRMLKVAPACAIMISSYEVGKQVFGAVNERALQKHGLEPEQD